MWARRKQGILGKLSVKELMNKWKMNEQVRWGKETTWRLNFSWNLLLVVKHVSVVWIFACFIFTFHYSYCISIIIIWCLNTGSLYLLPSFFWMLAVQLSLLGLNPARPRMVVWAQLRQDSDPLNIQHLQKPCKVGFCLSGKAITFLLDPITPKSGEGIWFAINSNKPPTDQSSMPVPRLFQLTCPPLTT